ncbi:hypothetical protein B0H63DRAFT_310607 [Podospora didyma]|uniref:Uncharacterized protein n=1 Tax=Podospora didyma TaxID=330526 RepID=A0AAE0K6H5_9PEZI|nr:hypothetical protein B0H63DRAFT_310607 [Podospora didyma]
MPWKNKTLKKREIQLHKWRFVTHPFWGRVGAGQEAVDFRVQRVSLRSGHVLATLPDFMRRPDRRLLSMVRFGFQVLFLPPFWFFRCQGNQLKVFSEIILFIVEATTGGRRAGACCSTVGYKHRATAMVQSPTGPTRSCSELCDRQCFLSHHPPPTISHPACGRVRRWLALAGTAILHSLRPSSQ